MSDLEQMYQQVILDHAKARHGSGLAVLEGVSVGESHQVNPTCGDEITVRVGLDGDKLTSLSWEGQGCSISQASASILTELMDGADLRKADETMEAFMALMHHRGEPLGDERDDLLDDATAFTGVGKYPARIKCALLSWVAMRDAIARATVGTEGP
ncbi:MAG: SUF system NifU family Fe-S cluster assembly protein [Demequinaceae bacterium]|nr:SUF system NifU family Fe-S cluster assembly protein [Demequinaceae bacterium]